MEKQALETIGQSGAALALAWGLIKSIPKIYTFVKGFFSKEEKTTVTVNVGTPQTPSCNHPDITSFKDDYRQFLYFLLEQGKILRAMHDMKGEILKEQMDYFDKEILSFKMLVTNTIMELLRDADIEDLHYTTYFSNFENFMDMSESKIKELYRQRCKDLKFSDYSISDFRDAANKHVKYITDLSSSLLRTRYPQRKFIKNFTKIYELKTQLEISLFDCLETARDIYTEKEKRVSEARACFEKQVTEIMGIPYSLEI